MEVFHFCLHIDLILAWVFAFDYSKAFWHGTLQQERVCHLNLIGLYACASLYIFVSAKWLLFMTSLNIRSTENSVFLIKGLLFEEKQHYLKQSCINYKLGWGDEI